MMAGVSCMSRLGPRLSHQIVCHSQIRLISSVGLQRARLSARKETLPRSSRNFWWSASKAPAVQEQPTLQEAPPQEALPVPGQPPAETASVVEPINATDAALASGVEPTAEASSLADVSAVTLDGPVPNVSSVPLDGVVPDVSTIASIAPLQYGDLAALGLTGWSPAGLCRWGIELLQVSTSLPWFWTIVGATVISRVVLFPFTVRSLQNTGRMAPYQPELLKLRDKMQEAQRTRDMLLLQNISMRQQMLYKKAGVSITGMLVMPFVQLPVTLGMFFAVKTLCDLPLQQLTVSGLDIFPNLAVADPTYVLPVASAVLMNLQLKVSIADMAPAPHTAHLINLFRVLSIAGILFMARLPAGVMVYLVTSISCILLQTLFLRIPKIRAGLGIPQIPKHMQSKSATFMESVDYVKQWWKDKKTEQEAAIRASRRK